MTIVCIVIIEWSSYIGPRNISLSSVPSTLTLWKNANTDPFALSLTVKRKSKYPFYIGLCQTMISSCFTSKLYGVLSTRPSTIRNSVSMPTIGKTSEESLKISTTEPLYAQTGVRRSIWLVMKMDAPSAWIALKAMDGRSLNSTH